MRYRSPLIILVDDGELMLSSGHKLYEFRVFNASCADLTYLHLETFGSIDLVDRWHNNFWFTTKEKRDEFVDIFHKYAVLKILKNEH